MRPTKIPRQAFENRLFVEPSSWAPPHQSWQERAQNTRELADLAKDGQAKNLLTQIAETYDRLAGSATERDDVIIKLPKEPVSVKFFHSKIRVKRDAP